MTIIFYSADLDVMCDFHTPNTVKIAIKINYTTLNPPP